MGRGADNKLAPAGRRNPFRQEIKDIDVDTSRQSEVPGGSEWRNERGDLHRDPSEGPARIITEDKAGGLIMTTEEWWQYGEKIDVKTSVSHQNVEGAQEWRDSDGQLHRDADQGPARVLPDGTEEYYLHGHLHRLGGPARIVDSGDYEMSERREEWWENGKLIKSKCAYTDSEPSSRTDYLDAKGRLHRDAKEGPAQIFSEPYVSTEVYYVHGVKGRSDGPAEIETYGEKVTERYFQDNLLHRSDGPAVLVTKEEGLREAIAFAWRGREFLAAENGEERWNHYRENEAAFAAQDTAANKSQVLSLDGQILFDQSGGGHKVATSSLLREAISSGTNMAGADLRGIQVIHADFKGGLFSGASFVSSDLTKSTFTGADLSGVDFSFSNLKGIDANGADLRGANFKGACLKEANFSGADVRGVNFFGLDLRGVVLSEANLEGADLRGVDLGGVDLRGANLTNTKLPKKYDSFLGRRALRRGQNLSEEK